MKEIPMLFSPLMVDAELDGRKTMTRRIVKGGFAPNIYNSVKLLRHEREDIGLQAFFFNEGDEDCWGIKCPYGKVGDVIWVRETFAKGYEGVCDNGDKYITFKNGDQMFQQAGYAKVRTPPTDKSLSLVKWKPSIHMPKWGARIWQQITAIRVERAQSISEADAIAEGIIFHKPVPGDGGPVYKNYMIQGAVFASPGNSFASLWEKINGHKSWEANPWVWVVEFKVLSTTGRPTNSIPLLTGAIATEAQ